VPPLPADRLPDPADQVVLLEVIAAARTWRGHLRAVDPDGTLLVALDDAPWGVSGGVGAGAELWASVQDPGGVYCFATRVLDATPEGDVRVAGPTSLHRTDDRRHERADGVELQVVLRILGPEGIEAVETVAVSVAAGGMRVQGDHGLVVGDSVGLTLALPAGAGDPISGVGRVVAVSDGAHVELTDLDPPERVRLARWVAHVRGWLRDDE
jgi:hypothetical protein